MQADQGTDNNEPRKDILLRQKTEIIQKFSDEWIVLPSKELREGAQNKSYYDGSKYDGHMREEKREGRGIYHYANGDVYAGEWKNNVFDGEGHYIFASGERYDGQLKAGKKHNIGKYYY
jgi:hypothetical protein